MSDPYDPGPSVQSGHDPINFSRPRREVSLAPPIDTSASAKSNLLKVNHLNQAGGAGRGRESRVDSANMAEGIFDLYGSNRASWQSSSSAFDDAPEEHGPGSVGRSRISESDLTSNGNGNGGPPQSFLQTPLRTSTNEQQGVEVLDDDGGTNGGQAPDSPASWEGVFTMLATSDHGTRESQLLSESQTNGSHPPTPPITLTPDKSVPQRPRPVRGRESNQTASSSTSLSVTPSSSRGQLGMSRLKPLSASTGSATSVGTTSANTSLVSFSGSSQYPGEENESFHVRSTYARLDAEGVHGDGWDPGVERTRGGPNAAKRVTIDMPVRGGNFGQSERQFLSSLDRYGFMDEPLRNRSESRIALIPAAPLRKIPKLPSKSSIPPGTKVQPPPPSFGPSTDDAPGPRPPPSPRPENEEGQRFRRKEDERVGKWMQMMRVSKRDQGGNIQTWEWRKDGQGSKLPGRVYKGIPDRWRMAAWWTLVEDNTRKWKGKGRATVPSEVLADEYRHNIDLPSIHDVQIDLDVPRTISGHTLFVTRYGSGQRSLFHVLHSFSLLCDTCGYCQGMGPIAATLLCYFDPERVYAILVRLHDVYGMHSIFAPGFPGLLESFYVQERLMEYLMPDVYKSFQRNMISSSAWGTKWYITLFVNTVPFSQQLRIWDALMMDGRDVIVIVSIAILWAFKDLLSDTRATFESILSLLSSYFVAEDEDAFMRWIRKILHQPGMKAKMDGWRAEWTRLVAEGKSHDALL